MAFRGQRLSIVLLILFSLLSTLSVRAQDPYAAPLYSRAELDGLLAPVALYPDPLLSQILMAATYPLEVVEASRWSRAHRYLEGAEAVAAAENQGWDPSVQSLTAFPDVLDRMDRDIEWTRAVGEAYLAQEEDVIDSIQRLRNHAYEAGQLRDFRHLNVYRRNEVVYIEPLTTSVVYVPYYDTRVVFADWWWPDYRPHYWGPPPGVHSSVSFYWGHGVPVTSLFFFSTFHWHDHHISLVDRDYFVSHYRGYRGRDFDRRFRGAKRWVHNRSHRGSVYRVHHRDWDRRDGYRRDREGYSRGRHDLYGSPDHLRSSDRHKYRVIDRRFDDNANQHRGRREDESRVHRNHDGNSDKRERPRQEGYRAHGDRRWQVREGANRSGVHRDAGKVTERRSEPRQASRQGTERYGRPINRSANGGDRGERRSPSANHSPGARYAPEGSHGQRNWKGDSGRHSDNPRPGRPAAGEGRGNGRGDGGGHGGNRPGR